MSFFEKIRQGLQKTKQSAQNGLNSVFASFRSVDDDLMDDLEESLILADIGTDLSVEAVDQLRDRVRVKNLKTEKDIREEICKILEEKMIPNEGLHLDTSPSVILVVGVNGVGKTTSVGKLGKMLAGEGKKVLFAAADTFRAAAADQLAVWAQRCGAEFVHHSEGADPSAVIFDSIAAAKARKCDVVICDTAGRLHNKKNLMNELAKMNRVIDRELPDASKETLLVVDATTGQNAIAQAESFNEACALTGIILTKLDGTAKGGIVMNISHRMGIPVKFVGVGEGADDLLSFEPKEFVRAFFE